jgi:hypothetical protein
LNRTFLLPLALVAVVLAACSGQGGASASASDSAAAGASQSTEATDAAIPSEGGAEPSADAGAGDLAAVLPEEVGGLTIEYESLVGEEVMGSEGVTDEARDFFDAVGAEPSDLSSAIGVAFDAEAGTGISIVAFRVAGTDESQLRDEFRATLEADGTVVTEDNVGGKDVLALDADETGASGGYLYVKGDIIFIVGGSPQELVDEAIASLP